MKKLILISLSALFFNLNIFGIIPSNRSLMIFPECGRRENVMETLNQDVNIKRNRPRGLGAVSSIFLTAIHQEASPIMIPEEFWNNILSHKKIFDDFQKENVDTLFNKYKKYKRFGTKALVKEFSGLCKYYYAAYNEILKLLKTHTSPNSLRQAIWANPYFQKVNTPKKIWPPFNLTYFEMSAYMMCAKFPFNKYIIKELSIAGEKQKAFLFIPKSYTKKVIKNYKHQLIKKSGLKISSKPNKTEINLGLKINNFPDLEKIIVPSFSGQPKSTSACRKLLVKILPYLLVKKNEYPKDIFNTWSFYVQGHGVYSQSVIELAKKQSENLSKFENLISSSKLKLSNYQKQLSAFYKKSSAFKKMNKAHEFNLKNAINMMKKNIAMNQKNLESYQKVIQSNLDANIIAGLNVSEFRKLLNFLNNQISTSLLYYSSCYAAGSNFIDPYKKLTTNKPIELNYTVVTDTLTDTPTTKQLPQLAIRWYRDGAMKIYVSTSRLVNFNKKEVIFHSPYNFAKFFRILEKPGTKPISYLNLFSNVSTFASQIQKSGKKHTEISKSQLINLPSIRFPGTSWFNVIYIPEKILSITAVKVLTQGSKPLIINKSVQNIKDAVLLYTPNILLQMEVKRPSSKTKFPPTVSMIPGRAIHTINKINAKSYKLTEILSGFFPFNNLAASKMFVIKELNVINDLNISQTSKNQLTKFKNIVLVNNGKFNNKQGNYIFLTTAKNEVFSFEWQAKQSLPSSTFLQNSIKKHKPFDYKNTFIKSTFQDIKKVDEEKFTGIIETTKGPEIVKISPIIKALQEKLEMIKKYPEGFDLSDHILHLKNLNWKLNSLNKKLKKSKSK